MPVNKKWCGSLRGLSFLRWDQEAKLIFPRVEVIWGFRLANETFYCIEKLVLQRNDEGLLKMRWSESVAREMCIFSVALLQIVNERYRYSTTSAFYGQESLFFLFHINYTVIIIPAYCEKFVHGWKKVEQMIQDIKLSLSFVSMWEHTEDCFRIGIFYKPALCSCCIWF